VDGHDIRGEFVHHPTENPSRIISQVTLLGLGLDRIIRRRPGEVEDGVPHVHQRLVESPLLDTLGPALAGVVPVGGRKDPVAFDSPDSPSPQLLPVLGNVQDLLHENVDVDENPVAFEVLDDILFVLGAIVFLSLVRIETQFLQDGRPKGNRSRIREGASGIAFALWRLQHELCRRSKG